MQIPVTIPTDPNETTGLRRATDFDPAQAADWMQAAQAGLDIGYADRGVLEIIAAFATAIRRQDNVCLSRETEVRISRLMDALRADRGYAVLGA